jgi:hypothetical protein
MSREWVDDMKKKPVDKRWVMRCDVGIFDTRKRCTTESEPSVGQPELWQFASQGWFIAEKFGDACPACLHAGYTPKDTPHRVMAGAAHV